MFLIGNILLGLAYVLKVVLSVYFWIVIIAAVISFFRPDPYNTLVRTLRSLTEPVMYAIRRRLPFLVQGGLDFAPVVVLLVIKFLEYAVVNNLFGLAFRLGAG